MKRKYIPLLIIFLLTLTTGAKAQRFQGGVLVGLNASQIDGDTWAGFFKGGLLTGAFVNTHLRDKWGAQLEIKYSAKGSAPHPESADYPMKIKLTYIDVPVVARYEAVNHLNIEGGLSINYLFNSKAFVGSWMDLDQEGLKSFETAIVIGINYQFFQRFDFNIRYNYSLLPIRGKYVTSTWGDGVWYSQVINFALYFHFGQTEKF